jgi:hypothetical protein
MLSSPGRGVVLSPKTTATMDGPLEVTLSFANVQLGPGELLAIIYWDTGMGDMMQKF